jgi:RNA polymerase sigma-70 factor (ECF subfamily)
MSDKFENLRHDDSRVTSLVILAQSGDKNAFGELFELFTPTVTALARRVLGRSPEVEDIVQEVFLRVVEKIGQLRDAERFAGWLRQMTLNMARSNARKDRGFTASEDDLLGQTASDAPTVLSELMGAEDRALMMEALQRLKPLDREVLVAFYMEGKPILEIAGELNAPLGTIKRRLHTARKRLAELIGPCP